MPHLSRLFRPSHSPRLVSLALVLKCLVSLPAALAQAKPASPTGQATTTAATKPLFNSGQINSLLLHSLWEAARTFWYVLALLAVIVAVRLVLSYQRYRRLSHSGIADIDAMDGRTFECYLETLFRRLGYGVELTPSRGDWGADLVVRQGSIKTVVQAKRWKKAVGVKAVQEVVASKAKYGCTEALVITNSTFTEQAKELARVNSVTLWDRSKLIQVLLKAKADKREADALEGDALGKLPFQSPVSSPQNSLKSGNSRVGDPSFGSICCLCDSPVSDKVAAYCQDNPGRFGGQIYCFGHQKSQRQSR